MRVVLSFSSLVFFFSAPAPPQIYTLSLHDALPIFSDMRFRFFLQAVAVLGVSSLAARSSQGPVMVHIGIVPSLDRKSTRLNSSHRCISYAVFCLKKKKNTNFS